MYDVGFYGGKFFPFHLGHLNCVLRAASQCKKLYLVCMYNGDNELDVWYNQQTVFDKKYLTPHIRELVMRKSLKNFPNIEVIMYDSLDAVHRAQEEGKTSWQCECEDVVNLIGKFDVCYSSEPEYHRLFQEYYPWADSVVFDVERKDVPISGTAIRDMKIKDAYQYLPREYQQILNKSVLIVGTESCGKTTLVKKLAKFFNTSYTEEYGRTVCEEYNMSSPGIEFYNEFLYGQKLAEVEAKKKGNIVYFCDSDSTITNFYARHFEQTNLPIADIISSLNNYDLILYVEPTVEWVADGLRKDGSKEERQKNNQVLKDMFVKEYGKEIKVLNGNYEQNYLTAISYVKEMLEG